MGCRRLALALLPPLAPLAPLALLALLPPLAPLALLRGSREAGARAHRPASTIRTLLCRAARSSSEPELTCAVPRPACVAWQRLWRNSRYPPSRSSARYVSVPNARSLNQSLVEGFFLSNGFQVAPVALESNASNTSEASGIFYYPPIPRTVSAGCSASRMLTIQALTIGTKDGLCRASRRATQLWPAFARLKPHPPCLVFPEDAAEIWAELLTGKPKHAWVFKRTFSGRSYGGQGLSIFRPSKNVTTAYVPILARDKSLAYVPKSSFPLPLWQLDDPRRRGVFQRMVTPLRVRGRTHSFRVFALITSTLPLRLYVWHESYVMLAGAPYKWVNRLDPASSSRSMCAVIVNSWFEKHVCEKLRDAGFKLQFLKLHRFLDLAARKLDEDPKNQGLRLTAAGLWDRIKAAILQVILADYPSFIGEPGQQLLGFDCMLDSEGKIQVLEANLTPGTTEDDAGRKLKMHTRWINMTGSFSSDFEAPWASCVDEMSPACLVQQQVDSFLRSIYGMRAGALERRILFEYERERRLSGGFEELYPQSASTLDNTAGHLRLFEAQDSLGPDQDHRHGLHEVARLSRVLMRNFLLWCDRNERRIQQTYQG